MVHPLNKDNILNDTDLAAASHQVDHPPFEDPT